MKKVLKGMILFTGVFVSFYTLSFAQEFNTTLEGKVIGKKIHKLYLHRITKDARGKKIIIPVKNGKFKKKITVNDREAYNIIYPYQFKKGAWKPVTFFMEPGEIKFSLYPKEPMKNNIKGDRLNNQYIELNHQLSSQFKNPARNIQNQLAKTTSAIEKENLQSKVDSLRKAYIQYRNNYTEKFSSPVSYYILYENIKKRKQFGISTQELRKYYKKLAQNMRDHPYTPIIKSIFQGIDNIKLGSNFIDFGLPDLNNERYKFSNLIRGKIALLDLWASWCGPCIRDSRQIVPIYEKYQGKDFTVIGVAWEFDNTSRLKKALKREQFPWKNLVDINGSHNIWRKYNMQAAGGMFLIEKEGKIIAINPTPKELRNILDSKI